MKKLARLRVRAFHAQQCRCIYCALPIWEDSYKERFASALGIPDDRLQYLQSTAEHLVAQQEGGPDLPVNIAAACWWCNWKRHAHRHDRAPDPVKYQAEVRRLMAAKRWHPAARWVLG
ncbi:restriction endonuclease [Acidovorax sp.]|uniref:restriction endonuclease n=1 Tax=Acidovorax sp. TaxID=1872122 RepID=UPI0025BF2859|nr:restriction endonuclease [Acidovorax sp.]